VFIVRLHVAIPVKFSLLLGTSLPATMLVHHFVVRPSAVARALLGLGPAVARGAGDTPMLDAAGRLAAARGRESVEMPVLHTDRYRPVVDPRQVR